MLLNNFYTIINHNSRAGDIKTVITFNKDHRIFEGHFPGHPVVPGVCMMQIVREVLELEISQTLKILTGDNVKFLSIINPEENDTVEVAITYGLNDAIYSVNATLSAGQVTYFKFKGTLQA